MWSQLLALVSSDCIHLYQKVSAAMDVGSAIGIDQQHMSLLLLLDRHEWVEMPDELYAHACQVSQGLPTSARQSLGTCRTQHVFNVWQSCMARMQCYQGTAGADTTAGHGSVRKLDAQVLIRVRTRSKCLTRHRYARRPVAHQLQGSLAEASSAKWQESARGRV